MEPDAPTWLDYLTAIGAITTPILVLALTGIGWRLRTRIERRLALEDQMREDRIEVYHGILQPYILLLMTKKAWEFDPKNKGKDKDEIAMRTLLSLEYRQLAFRLTLIGSDAVVNAYNELTRYFSSRDPNAPADPAVARETVRLLSQFLLEIRRSMGNEDTAIGQRQMVESFIAEPDLLRELR